MILIALLLVQILHLNSLGVCYYFFGASCTKTVFNIVVNLVIVAIDPIDLIWMTIDHQKVFVTMVTSGLQVAFLTVRKKRFKQKFSHSSVAVTFNNVWQLFPLPSCLNENCWWWWSLGQYTGGGNVCFSCQDPGSIGRSWPKSWLIWRTCCTREDEWQNTQRLR